MSGTGSNHRLLVFNCHEAWVHQLRALDREIDIIVGLPGRLADGWDTAMRPVPPNARCVRLNEVLAANHQYDCIIAHNLTDLLDVKSLEGPRLLVIHCTLGSMILEQRTVTPPDELRHAVSQYVRLIGAHVMPVSRLKGRSWGLDKEEDVVPFSADPADYLPYMSDLSCGLRVANQIRAKTRTLRWDFHEKAFAGLPVSIVGRNDGMPGVVPARDWDDLKSTLSRHRFFIHTADPALEDGYNMAMLEAMAAGLPVLGNRHPTSPIVNGVNGFTSDDPMELRAFARKLIGDRELAMQLGREARKTVTRLFSPAKFIQGFESAIQTAEAKWAALRNSRAGASIETSDAARG